MAVSSENGRRGRTCRMVRRAGCELHIYPNVVYIVENGEEVMAITTEQWAEMVAAVGVCFMPEGDPR